MLRIGGSLEFSLLLTAYTDISPNTLAAKKPLFSLAFNCPFGAVTKSFTNTCFYLFLFIIIMTIPPTAIKLPTTIPLNPAA